MIKYLKAVLFIILVLILIQPSLAGTWEDDFSKKNISEWEIFNISTWEYDPDLDSAKWEIKNGEVYGSMHELFKKSMFLTGQLTWRNYSVSCRAKFVGDKDKTAILGLILHARVEENKRYMFLINYFDQKASIVAVAGKLKQGGEPFKGWTQEIVEFDIKFDTWYLLSASVVGNNKLHFKIENLTQGNNKIEFSTNVIEPIDKGGLTGFLVENADAVFDDIEISGNRIPNGGTFPVEPLSKLTTTWSKLKRK